MGLTEKILNKALQKLAKKAIIDVFEREVEEHSEQLKVPKGKILGYISRYLIRTASGFSGRKESNKDIQR